MDNVSNNKREVIKLKDLAGTTEFKNCTIGISNNDYGVSYILFHDNNKITFINKNTFFHRIYKNTRIGNEFTELLFKYDLKNKVFDLTLKPPNNGGSKSCSLNVYNIRDK